MVLHTTDRQWRCIMHCAIVLICCPCFAFAQSSGSDSMGFSLQNPTILGGRVRINGPPNITLHHHQRDDDLNFGTQQWSVICNANRGAEVRFRTQFAFRNGNNHQRDAKLDLSIARSDPAANWTVTQASDVTDYINRDREAVVTAESDAAGNATFNLNVTFITGNFSTLRSGTYRTTVFGTITAN